MKEKEYSIIIDEDRPFDKVHEECGVFGIVCGKDEQCLPAWEAYHALFALQHRGQESCGIAVNDRGVLTLHKDVGLVPEVFSSEILDKMPGQMAIGHCRYSTTGSSLRENAQPILARHIKGTLALAHNGNLVNATELRKEIELSGGIFQTTNDSEVIAHMIVRERLSSSSIEEAVYKSMHRIKGAYSIVIMSPRKMIAARDPNGFRPLCIGKRGESYIFASETCALDALGAEFVRDIEPGEIVTCIGGELHSTFCQDKADSTTCIFEYIYFARPDSVIDGASVEMARQECGKYLAQTFPVDADIVIGVPDSGIPAAIGYSKYSGIPYGVGLIKNRYVARTFIQPTQEMRERAVKIKLNALATAVKGQRVIMVDDSIVRGTTCARIVRLLKEAGATEVHVRVSSPPFLFPCYFGTDVPDKENLIAHNRTIEEMRDIIGADSLGFLPIEATRKLAPSARCGFCDACFSGNYPIPVPEKVEKNPFEQRLEI
ncbi:MAG: amidophosphoribosyltransferase [Clostridiaceae bacterium]|nr:amidophosphoribosyltransferase [Clostridiaceae bacterium]